MSARVQARVLARRARTFLHLTILKNVLFVVVTSDNKKKARGLGARTPRLLSSGNIIHPESQKKIFRRAPLFRDLG